MRQVNYRTFLAFLMAFVMVLAMAVTASAKDYRAEILNGVELNPERPGSEALNTYLDELLPTILTDDMDAYGQVKACYDYLVSTVSYGSHIANLNAAIGTTNCNAIYQSYGEVEGFGAVALSAKVGMCNAYNSAFILMVRKIGLNANLVEGYTKSGGGGYVYHKWTEVTIGDQIYVFDPQLEQNLVASGLERYTVFCRTYEEIPGRYSK